MKIKLTAIILTAIIMLSSLAALGCFIGFADGQSVTITGVGIFDQNPNKGMHTFNPDAKLIQVTFNGNFYDKTVLDGSGTKLWVQSQLGEFIKINGVSVAEWNDRTFNSVQIHVKTSAGLGQYLEFNFSGLEGLPTEATDATFEFSKDFPISGGTTLGVDYLFSYRGGSGLPFISGKLPDISEITIPDVTGVGVFDQSPAKGIHTFNPDAKLFQVTFSSDFYEPAALNNGEKLWVQSELGDFIKINGFTVTEWNQKQFNSVQIHVKTNKTTGQFLEFNINGLSGLPTSDTQSCIEFSEDFPILGIGKLGKPFYFVYSGTENIPFEISDHPIDITIPEETTPEINPDDIPAKLLGVGVFDQTPEKGIHTFNDTAKLIQAKFKGIFYDPAALENGQKMWVQSELGKYIKVNGKTVAEWNAQEFNSAQIHVKTSSLIGQFLEFNFSGLDGLPREDTDNEIIFLADFPLFGGTTLGEDIMFAYRADDNIPFALNGIFPEEETTPEETTDPSGGFIIVEDDTTAEQTTASETEEKTDPVPEDVTTAQDAVTTTVTENTSAAEITTVNETEKSGCGGSIGTVLLLSFVPCAAIIIKKKNLD